MWSFNVSALSVNCEITDGKGICQKRGYQKIQLQQANNHKSIVRLYIETSPFKEKLSWYLNHYNTIEISSAIFLPADQK